MTRSITPILAVVGAGLGLAAGSATAATSSSTVETSTIATGSTAPPVGPQQTWTGKTSPVDLDGTGIEQGDRLPKGSVLVYRAINVPRGQRRRVRLVVPRGEQIVTAAQTGSFSSGVVNANYVGRRSVTIRVSGGQNGAVGRLYAYAR